MSKLNLIQRIIKEDFPDEVQKWIDKLLVPLNNAISQISYALSNQLTIADNLLGTVKVFTLKSSQFPYEFAHGLKVKPQIVLLGQILETSASPPPFTVAPQIVWTTDGPNIFIQTITGLDPTRSYTVTLWVQGA